MGVRAAVGRTAVLVGLAVVVGVVAALVWANLAVLPRWTVQSDGHAEIADAAAAHVFSATFWYAIIGLLGGLAVGVAAWARLRSVGWPVAVVSALLGVVSGLACWWAGRLMGPGAFDERLAAAEAGAEVSIALDLLAPSALGVWVFAAVAVPLFAASLGPEVGGGDPVSEPEEQTAPA